MVVADFFRWTGWSFFVAVGTLALALVTWRVARQAGEQIGLQTREVDAVEEQTRALAEQTAAVHAQAAAAARLAEVSSASLEAGARPVLVAHVARPEWRAATFPESEGEAEPVAFSDGHLVNAWPEEAYYEETEKLVYCSVPLRNVGAGVAFVQSVILVTRTEYSGRVSRVVVPPDETTRAKFSVNRYEPDGTPTDAAVVTSAGRGFPRFTIRLSYTGASRDLLTITEITASQVPDGRLIYTEQRVWDKERTDERLLVSTDNIG